MKRGFNSEFNRCKFAIMYPELTYSVSQYQTACGVVDIMAHTMEWYFIPCEPTDLTDRIAESILKATIAAGEALIKNPRDYNARANMMWASSLSDVKTFATKAEGGTLPTVYNTYTTEIRKIIDLGYSADITATLKNSGYYDALSTDMMD